MAKKFTQDRLRDYAKVGAALRASELQAEINEIYRAFPELKLKKKSASGASNGAGRAEAAAEAPVAAKATRRRTAPKWSAAARRAVSQRMKKYWAERRRAG